MISKFEKQAKEYFISGNFSEAGKIYSNIDMFVEQAYCEIFCGNLDKAKKITEKFKMESPVEEWVISFIELIEMDLKKKPSFLQIRNFFEIDLSNLFLGRQKEYIENVINMVPYLVNINPEIFKLTARVLKDNEQDNLALNFLKESLNICFFDSETHFLMAELCLKYDEKERAIKHLRYANKDSNYYPAIKLLNNISCDKI